jgi:DNA-binding NarL/FixJ family response regulator
MPKTQRNVHYTASNEQGLAGSHQSTKFETSRLKEVLRHGKDSHGTTFGTMGKSKTVLPEPAGRSSRLDAQTATFLTVLVADDHPMVREGLVAVINRRSDMRVTAEASNGREAVEQFLAVRPDIALLDLRMPLMDGIEAVMSICEQAPTARLVIVTTYQSEEDIYRALRAGAQGYLLKDTPVSDLVECIQTVGSGKTWIPPAVGAKLAKRITDRALTTRETEVIRALAKGKSNKEIGVALNISEGTVKVHVTHMLEKLKVTGRTEAIGTALRRGLVTMD